MLLYLRYALIVVYIGIWGILCIPIGLIRPRSPFTAPIVGGSLGKVVMKILGVKMIVEDHQKFYPGKPVVFCGNHQSNIDAFVLGWMVPKNTVFLGKKSILYIPLFGLITWFVGTIFIDRGKRNKAISTMDQAAEEIKKKGVCVFVMPEGTRSHGKGLGRFKKGAFHTAIKAEVPIVPIAFSDYHKYLNFNKWNSGVVLIRCLDPIDSTGKSVEELLNETRDVLSKNVEELNQRLESQALL